MNKTICNIIEYVLRSELVLSSGEEITLQPGVLWKPVQSISKPVYQSETSQSGLENALNKQTVSVQVKYDKTNSLIAKPLLPVILKMHSDSGIFYVGSYDLPVRLTLTSNKITATLTFKTASPV